MKETKKYVTPEFYLVTRQDFDFDREYIDEDDIFYDIESLRTHLKYSNNNHRVWAVSNCGEDVIYTELKEIPGP